MYPCVCAKHLAQCLAQSRIQQMLVTVLSSQQVPLAPLSLSGVAVTRSQPWPTSIKWKSPEIDNALVSIVRYSESCAGISCHPALFYAGSESRLCPAIRPINTTRPGPPGLPDPLPGHHRACVQVTLISLSNGPGDRRSDAGPALFPAGFGT